MRKIPFKRKALKSALERGPGTHAEGSSSSSMQLSERCWIPLLLLKLHGGRIATSLKLQKLVFLIQTEGRVKQRYRFMKRDYGPYSDELTLDMEVLSKNFSMVSIKTNMSASGYPYKRCFVATLAVMHR
jgi:hypothetical protein